MRRRTKDAGADRPARRPRRLPQVLNAEEVEALLAQVNPRSLTGLRNLLGLLLMVRNGLRVSEICQLAVADLDLKERRAHIVQGKGSRDRIVFLDGQVATVASQWLERRKLRSRWLLPTIQSGRRGTGAAKAGAQMKVRSWQSLMARIGQQAGIAREKCHPHTLRHTYATLELQRGVPIHQVQKDLGHSDLQTTSIYLHLTDGDRQARANGRPPLALPGEITEPEAPAPANGGGDDAATILAALGWRKQGDGSWMPPRGTR